MYHLAMFALVTGGTGFIGSNLVGKLLEKGWQVRVISRRPGLSKKIDWLIGDIANRSFVEEASSGVDIVFNLAGALPYHNAGSKTYWDTNVVGVENILKACLVNKKLKRLIHISTVGIYGQTDRMVNEKSPIKPDSIYAKTKAEGEKLVTYYYKKYKIPAVIIRPTIGYGPFDKRPGFLNLFRLLKKGLLIPLGNGQNFFHTVYAGNLVDALLLAAFKKKAIGEDFIIGDEPCPKMADILEEMEKLTKHKLLPFYLPTSFVILLAFIGDFLLRIGIKFPIFSQRVKFLTENKIYSIEKAKKLLGYNPKVSLREGLARTLLWYQKKGLIR